MMTSFRLPSLAAGMLGIAAVALLTACGGDRPQVDFSRQEPAAAEEAASPPSSGALRMAVAPILSPVATSHRYEQLADYLAARLGERVELIQGKTYAEINDLVKSGDATLALVCTNPYLDGREEFGMELLVAPRVDGDTVYYSLLIVGGDEQAQSLDDLRGLTFAFSDPLSNTGRLAPLYQLALMGESPDSFFDRTIFTYAHDSSIRAVADGVVNAAAVDSVVFNHMRLSEPSLIGNVKVIERWGPYGIYPFVVNPRLDPEIKARLRQVLLDMHEDVEGKEILRNLGVDRFVVPNDNIYDSVIEMRAFLRDHGLAP
ncbi:MAG: phosphate/phosphite/phosphonate ABC transporter substrate-binding protein [Dehalococcoidia bacterium]|nr:MAG: phosphate/phosphite/phosphonate ABC transporter substrate-binding protein [Dehalococcoidia bacterium]